MIIAGALNLMGASAVFLFVPVAAPVRHALFSVAVAALLLLATGIVAIVGGIFALQHRRWGLSLAGAICALAPPATLLGTLSVIFIALSREEYLAAAVTPGEPAPLSPQPAEAPATEGAVCDVRMHEPSEAERNA